MTIYHDEHRANCKDLRQLLPGQQPIDASEQLEQLGPRRARLWGHSPQGTHCPGGREWRPRRGCEGWEGEGCCCQGGGLESGPNPPQMRRSCRLSCSARQPSGVQCVKQGASAGGDSGSGCGLAGAVGCGSRPLRGVRSAWGVLRGQRCHLNRSFFYVLFLTTQNYSLSDNCRAESILIHLLPT